VPAVRTEKQAKKRSSTPPGGGVKSNGCTSFHPKDLNGFFRAPLAEIRCPFFAGWWVFLFPAGANCFARYLIMPDLGLIVGNEGFGEARMQCRRDFGGGPRRLVLPDVSGPSRRSPLPSAPPDQDRPALICTLPPIFRQRSARPFGLVPVRSTLSQGRLGVKSVEFGHLLLRSFVLQRIGNLSGSRATKCKSETGQPARLWSPTRQPEQQRAGFGGSPPFRDEAAEG
jgi:hypothetical protein